MILNSRYTSQLHTISDNNKTLNANAVKVSNNVKQAILLSIQAKTQWTKLEEGLNQLPQLTAQVDDLMLKLSKYQSH